MANIEEMAQWAVANPTSGCPNAGRRVIQKHFGASRRNAEKAAIMARELTRQERPAGPGKSVDVAYAETKAGATLETRSYKIRTVEDALKYAKVDVKTWQVDHFVVNKWDMGYKDEDGKAHAKQLWQVKVWLKRHVLDARELGDIVGKLMDEHSPHYDPLPVRSKPKHAGLMAEPCLMDLHVGKYAWAEETGENYDYRIAVNRLYAVTEDLIAKIKPLEPELILLPTGNDLLNTDNPDATTTGGTGQDVDTRHKKIFSVCKEAIVNVIDRWMTVAPVEVKIVPGNHDKESIFHLGDSLQSWYRNVPDVTIDNRAVVRKYFRWGNVLLGFTHGDRHGPKEATLPLIMAQEEKEMWAKTTWREWHTGHLHKKGQTQYVAGDTYNGVYVRRIPSLCGTDAWHFEKGYVKGWKLAMALLWDKELGYAGELPSGIDPWAAENVK